MVRAHLSRGDNQAMEVFPPAGGAGRCGSNLSWKSCRPQIRSGIGLILLGDVTPSPGAGCGHCQGSLRQGFLRVSSKAARCF